MDERELRAWIGRVKDGTIGRREFTRMLAGVGLGAPMAAQLLAAAGIPRRAAAQAKPAFTPARRGGGGELKTLWWQAVSILNCHLAVGVKDNDGSRLFGEPLAAFDPDGNLVPILAAEVPTLENGGVAKDGLSVTWKLKRNVQWHDGKPFTADDVVFTWEFVADPATAATTAGNYKDIARIDKVDSHTVKIGFKNPTPFWAISFCGPTGLVIPRHVFEPFKGAKSREAPANLKPVGTGPYRYVDFKPNDVVRAELNPNYHVPNWPFFDRVEMKGGGDAISAARAVLQTGEYDFAWNLQVEDDILRRMEQGGKGRRGHRRLRQHRARQREPVRPLDRGRRRALQRQDHASAPLRSGRPPGALPPRRPRRPSRSSSTGGPGRRRPTTSTRRAASSRRTPGGSSASTRPTRSSIRPAGSAAPTGSAPRTASA